MRHPTPTRARCGAYLIGAVGTLVGLASHATGQELERAVPETVIDKSALRDRNRAGMHPGSPLTVAGREQGDNDLRSRTPALTQGTASVVMVDPGDNYSRTLAMYEQGTKFHRPVALLVDVEAVPIGDQSSPEENATGADPQAEAPVEATSGGARWRWALSAGLIAALMYLAQKRWGRMPGQSNPRRPNLA